jgi:hypothetical protein
VRRNVRVASAAALSTMTASISGPSSDVANWTAKYLADADPKVKSQLYEELGISVT